MFLFLFFLPFSSLNQSIDEWSVSPQTDKVWNMCVHCINILALHKHNMCMKSSSFPSDTATFQYSRSCNTTDSLSSVGSVQHGKWTLATYFQQYYNTGYKDSALCLRAMTGTKGTTVENCPYFPSTTSLINLSPSHSNNSSTMPCTAIKSPSQILLSLTWSYTNRKYSNVAVPKINEWKIQQDETRNAVVYF